MELWIPITVVAAFCQNLRSALQKGLTATLSAEEASYVRFCYAVPFVALFVVALGPVGGYDLPAPNARWSWNMLAGSVFQVLATVALIQSFGHRNFAAATAYSKTETVQTAAFGFVILGDAVTSLALVGILVSLGGVLLLSRRVASGSGARDPGAPTTALRGMLSPGRGAWLGMAAGAGFAVSAVSYRAASLALPEGEFFVRAAVTLLGATLVQTLGMGTYLAMRRRGALSRVARSWRVSVFVGLAGMLASAGWFSAMTLEAAAYVRALGQLELLFAFAAGVVFFRERMRGREVAGAALVVLGLVLVLA